MTERQVGLWLLAVLAPPAALAQGDLDLHYGRWRSGPSHRDAAYELRGSRPLFGPFTHGLGLTFLIDDSLGRHHAFYGAGYEVQAFRPAAGVVSAYGLLGVALGLSTDTARQELAAQWSVGGGVEWRLFSRLGIDVESRYRVEDRGPRGFWNPREARKGFSISAGLTMRLGSGRASGPSGRAPYLPPAEPPATIAGGAADVVRTALDAIGSPYQWGGTAANGFDCSGLVQYAYGQHGIRLPRMSRDQAKAGTEVTPVVDALVPGDILLFAATPGGGVTHVGMYVGEGKFIHSSNTGVRLSRLDPHDPEGGYWISRWVGARRVMTPS